MHKIFPAVDENNENESFAVLLSMMDWSQAFDQQCHTLGVQSFINNDVRYSLIPLMISYLGDRKMKVKWNGHTSIVQSMNGGGAQGGLPGILEYLSQNNDCADFLNDDQRYKFIDDLSVLEIINLISLGISSYNCKLHIPSDIATNNLYIDPSNLKSQDYINQIEQWTKSKKMKLNTTKSKYMIINFSSKYQSNTRLEMEGKLLEQVQQTRLLGVIIDQSFSWQANTNFIVQKAYKRMSLLHKLYEFAVPIHELIEIYILYIRSVLESSAVVWNSSLTQGQEKELERVQKVALRIILKDQYENYENALLSCSIPTLKDRRKALSLSFAKKCVKNENTSKMFPVNRAYYNTRNKEKYAVTRTKMSRLAKIAIPYMQKLQMKIISDKP